MDEVGLEFFGPVAVAGDAGLGASGGLMLGGLEFVKPRVWWRLGYLVFRGSRAGSDMVVGALRCVAR